MVSALSAAAQELSNQAQTAVVESHRILSPFRRRRHVSVLPIRDGPVLKRLNSKAGRIGKRSQASSRSPPRVTFGPGTSSPVVAATIPTTLKPMTPFCDIFTPGNGDLGARPKLTARKRLIS